MLSLLSFDSTSVLLCLIIACALVVLFLAFLVIKWFVIDTQPETSSEGSGETSDKGSSVCSNEASPVTYDEPQDSIKSL